VSSGFSPGKSGGVVARFEAAEVSLLRSLVSMMLGLVSPGETSDDPLERALGIGIGNGDVPSDPVLARLFPSAYEDAGEAAEFRRYTEATLRDGKRADAQTVFDTARSGATELTPEQAQAWLRALNDVRLTLGTKLEVTEEIHDEIAVMSEDDPRYPAYVTYDWLTYLQDTLVRALW
jgi:truncated hemoglobin YjbI